MNKPLPRTSPLSENDLRSTLHELEAQIADLRAAIISLEKYPPWLLRAVLIRKHERINRLRFLIRATEEKALMLRLNIIQHYNR